MLRPINGIASKSPIVATRARFMTDIFQFQESLVEEYKRFSTSFTSIRASDIRQVVEGAQERGDY